MKISTKINDIINKQVNHEFYAAYLYLSMSADFENKGFSGFAHWMKLQSQEEVEHAMKLFDYLNERGGKVTLTSIETPKAKWTTVLEAFDDALKHEMKVTQLIHNMVDLAQQEKDHATVSFLQWFVDEQVEEESSANEIVDKLKLIGENKPALYMLNKELGSRK